MKILKESKEALPITYITTFVSKGWDKVGELKEEIKAITETFKDTTEVVECVNDLIDTYLICIGKMESLLSDKNYIEVPEEEAENETVAVITEKEPAVEPKVDLEIEAEEAPVVEETPVVTEVSVDNFNPEKIVFNNDEAQETKKKAYEPEAFEYYCDFD